MSDMNKGDEAATIDENDHQFLAAAVELTLELLDAAERRRSFPGPRGEPGDFDEENEHYKREAIKNERRRFKEIRARLVADECHGVPVAREFLESALGLFPTVISDDETDQLYEQWVGAGRVSGTHQGDLSGTHFEGAGVLRAI